MMLQQQLPLFPQEASTVAPQVDTLFAWVVALAAFFATLVCVLVVVFAIKYRRRSESEVPAAVHGSLPLELVWTLIPLALALVTFYWGAKVYFTISRPPDNAIDIYVVAKQWMWKFQHPEGIREIDELHVPVGRPVRLTMASEDVIHSFFVPAFRIKQDVVPGRYTTTWFQATKIGRYHLFCSQYCGTSHSQMTGWVQVMAPADYQAWLAGTSSGGTMASRGERLFQDLACVSCHMAGPSQRGPSLAGIFGKTVQLEGGGSVTVDDLYLRESILNPAAKVVKGFQPVMPVFQGLVDEEGLLALITYIKSLSPENQGQAPAGGPSSATAATGSGGLTK